MEDYIMTTDDDPYMHVENLAGFGGHHAYPYGISPSSYFDETFQLYYVADTGLGPSETLYTARGSQGMGLKSSRVEDMEMDTSDFKSTFLL